MPYRLFEWDAETQKLRKLAESGEYEEIWDGWVEQPGNRVIVCKVDAGTQRDGKASWYLVTRGRKPGIYESLSSAQLQTKGITGDPEGYPFTAQTKLIQDWLAARVDRREERDVEIVRKSCGCCWYCGTTLVSAYGKHLGKGQRDHQTSRVNHGGNEIDNLVLACERCNTAGKNSLNLDEYRAKVQAQEPGKYSDGVVRFFGELPLGERHRLKQQGEPGWVCPGTADIPCTQIPAGK